MTEVDVASAEAVDSILRSIRGQALEAVQSAILVTEAMDSDRPIVYINSALEILTDYSAREVLGRDCRFLQNDDTDQIGLQDIRSNLLLKKPVRAVLRNYRKDGTLFYNEIFINPIYNKNREVSHFIGCQNAIESPEAAQLRAEAIELFGNLNKREKEVFKWVVRGYSSKAIACRMGLSPRTVEQYRLRMQKHMRTNNL